MNARKSLLFFCSILAGLALLCVCFPAEGLPLIGGIRLRFPALAEVMGQPERQEDAIFEEADTLPPLTPEELLQMQRLYEAVNGEEVDKRNFRKRVKEMEFIEKTELIDKTGSKRGAYLYRFNSNTYDEDPIFKL